MTTVRYGKKAVDLPIAIEGNRARIVRGDGPVVAGKSQAGTKGKSPFDSKLEAEFDLVSKAMLQAGDLKRYWHHPFRMTLPGEDNRYEPDYLWWLADGRLQIREVKNRRAKGFAKGLTKLKTAAGCYPWAEFYLMEKEEGRWIETPVRPC